MPFFFDRRTAGNLVSNIESMGSGGEDLIEDPDALEAAQEAANAVDPDDVYQAVDASWVPVLGPTGLQGMADASGLTTGRSPCRWRPRASPSRGTRFRPRKGRARTRVLSRFWCRRETPRGLENSSARTQTRQRCGPDDRRRRRTALTTRRPIRDARSSPGRSCCCSQSSSASPICPATSHAYSAASSPITSPETHT